jgi:hypothetical protein
MRHRRPRALCAEEGSDASAYLPIVQPLATINAPSWTKPNPPHLKTLKRARVAARGLHQCEQGRFEYGRVTDGPCVAGRRHPYHP